VTRRFDQHVLDIDCEHAIDTIGDALRTALATELHRRGVVVGVSGGVDSAVCAALAVRALGPERVLGLLMPEFESDPEGTERARLLCEALGVAFVIEDVGPILEAAGCYRRRDEVIRRLFDDYGPGYRQKISITPNLYDRDQFSYFELTVEAPDGEVRTARMPADVYAQVVAATNMKQRTRKMIEYLHAESRNFAVLGTPNRLEYELGFFVRGGDGLADVKPIAHLYKTQVYALAEHLEIPAAIRDLPPSTDTYSLPQTQTEFYFSLPYGQMDLVLWAWEHGVQPADLAPVVDLRVDQVERAMRDVAAKRRVARRGLRGAVLVEDVDISERA
jgi:NAD+ synthase